MKHEFVDPLVRLHSAAIGAPKRAKPVTGPQPTHPMCAAMGRAYWAAEDVRMAKDRPAPFSEHRYSNRGEYESGLQALLRDGSGVLYPAAGAHIDMTDWHGSLRAGCVAVLPSHPIKLDLDACGAVLTGCAIGTSVYGSSGFLRDAMAVTAACSTLNAASGDVLVGTKPQPDADGWIPFVCTHTSACPVPDGVEFEVWFGNGNILSNIREPISWRLLNDGVPCGGDVVAYRTLPAKPAALTGWRRGPDVPYDERNSGLWFVRRVGAAVGVDNNTASRAAYLGWYEGNEYRPAPPGAREGDAYSPALYGEDA
jgi:hypothetical protein